ncbi:MAG: TRIC cation channel family protein [Deltaproteobacteria bacterium]|nr:TRIC cation channel family protein [Deltaproteobacteria bacterium]
MPPAFVPQLTWTFFAVDLAGVFAGALAGALTAERRHEYDVIGVAGVALAAGVGGGLLRDTLLQHGTPLALTNPTYLLTVLVAVGLAWFFGWRAGARSEKAILFMDALALGWYAVSSTLRTQDAGLGLLPCLLLGVIGAVGGGICRDLLSGETPRTFRAGELYAVAALAGSATFLALRAAPLPRPIPDLVGAAVGSGIRLLSLRFGWRAPLPPRAPASATAPTGGSRAEGHLD